MIRICDAIDVGPGVPDRRGEAAADPRSFMDGACPPGASTGFNQPALDNGIRRRLARTPRHSPGPPRRRTTLSLGPNPLQQHARRLVIRVLRHELALERA